MFPRRAPITGLTLLFGLAFAGCAPRSAPVPAIGAKAPVVNRTVRVGLTSGVTRQLPLEEYVRGAAAAELTVRGLSPAAAAQAWRVQAILARTYALANLGRHRASVRLRAPSALWRASPEPPAEAGFDLCDTTHCQVFRPASAPRHAPNPVFDAAMSETHGVTLLWRGAPIQAVFHADCGGHTSAADEVWGGRARPYLRAVSDGAAGAGSHMTWRFAVEASRLRAALNEDRRTTVGSRLDRIAVVERDEAGRVMRVVLDGERSPMLRGEELRARLAARFGGATVRSAWFDVRQEAGLFVFEGRGFGHGVGLCQAGALRRARAGLKAEAILKTFFPGVEIRKQV